METLQTGDLLLFHPTKPMFSSFISCFSDLVDWLSGSQYSHVAMVLKDPTYIDPKLKGYYMLESGIEEFGDAEDNKIKFGVQISNLEKVMKSYPGNIYVRRLNVHRDKAFEDKIVEMHKKVHNLPYDINIKDWVEAYDKVHKWPCWQSLPEGEKQKRNTYWCSALIAFAYVQLGYLKEDTPWTLISPRAFSSKENEQLDFINCTLTPEILIKEN